MPIACPLLIAGPSLPISARCSSASMRPQRCCPPPIAPSWMHIDDARAALLSVRLSVLPGALAGQPRQPDAAPADRRALGRGAARTAQRRGESPAGGGAVRIAAVDRPAGGVSLDECSRQR